MLNFSIKNVGENKYVGTMTGGTPGGSYTMQMKIAPPVVNDWVYAGYYEADSSGKVVTFEFVLPDPENEYPYMFRFRDDVTGAVSNVVTVGAESNFNVLIAIVAIIAFVVALFVVGKKVK